VLLRASGEDKGGYDLQAMMGGGDGGVADGEVLIAYAEAVMGVEGSDLTAAAEQLRQALGEAALVDAAAVIATFNAVDRMADATGTPLEDYKAEATAEWRADLGLDAFTRPG
jgi:uncharacterized protein YhdP|tara:strand:- start:34 stop:369 length:336 start_codon:yes stop_codon:yes gene_type:complete